MGVVYIDHVIILLYMNDIIIYITAPAIQQSMNHVFDVSNNPRESCFNNPGD